jgi:RNA polymerase sigma-70 factor, ECF subfamily
MSATAADSAGGGPRDGEDFARLTDPYRPELLAHCYRMLGSVHDAEDLVQETLLRAWRSRDGFEGRASVRTWLYRIATNVCLRAIENRGRRPLPAGLGAPASDPDRPLAGALPDVPWLEPLPDALLRGAPGGAAGAGGAGGAGDPASIVVSRQSTRLALVAALQYLPARQRAVLILRDVLGWHAAEVAGLLQISTVAVNSALQRARAALRQAGVAEDDVREPADHDTRAVVDRYAAAFENADVAALTRLLADDAVLEMPPLPTWFAGRALIGRFFGAQVLREPGGFLLTETAANGQPAFGAYTRGAGGAYRAHAIAVLEVRGAAVSRIVTFLEPELFRVFGLPLVVPAGLPGRPVAGQDGRPGPLGVQAVQVYGRAGREQPVAGAKDGGEDQQPVLVDQVRGHQRAHDAQAARDDDVARLAPDRLDEVPVEDPGVRPRRGVGEGAAGHQLLDGVHPRGERVGAPRPDAGEQLPGLPAEQQDPLVHDAAHPELVPRDHLGAVPEGPAAGRRAAGPVRVTHDPVEGDELDDDDAHDASL